MLIECVLLSFALWMLLERVIKSTFLLGTFLIIPTSLFKKTLHFSCFSPTVRVNNGAARAFCATLLWFYVELMCIRCIINPETRSSPYVGLEFWKQFN